MTTKFGVRIVFRKAQVSAKYNCPTSTLTLFSEYRRTRIQNPLLPVIQSQKRSANPGGTIVYSYPCYVRRRGWMPTGLLSEHVLLQRGLLRFKPREIGNHIAGFLLTIF